MTTSDTYRLLAVADSDSYAKWAAGILDTLPGDWHTDLVIVRTPIAPSRQQITAAVAGTRLAQDLPRTLTARRFKRLVSTTRPDVVLLAATGPVVDVLMSHTLAGIQPRPAFVSGLPGISVPATERAILFRSAVDLFVIHSHREVDEFKQLAASMGVTMDIALATLPSLNRNTAPVQHLPRDRVIFASQALVPHTRNEREQILLALAKLADNRADITPVVKLRTTAGEAQTHREKLAYDDLWRELARQGRVRHGSVLFENGPMHDHLQRSAGFVTVSSTAALEAIAANVPTLILSDFGVSAEMINTVFMDSGLLGTLDDLTAGRLFQPDSTWLGPNYFHSESESDILPHLNGLAHAAKIGRLAERSILMDDDEHARSRRYSMKRLYVHPQALRLRRFLTKYLRPFSNRLAKTILGLKQQRDSGSPTRLLGRSKPAKNAVRRIKVRLTTTAGG